MNKIVGSIGPAAEITEAPGFAAPTRTLPLSDTSGNLHGMVQWLSSEVDEEFLAELAVLCSVAMRSRLGRSPSVGST
jgi:hypothetical protein